MARWTPAGPLDEILKGDGIVTPALKRAAEKVKRRVEATHRMRSTPTKYGDLEITENASDATVTLAATGPFAHLEEWGSINNPPYMSMRRAVAAEGYDFREVGR